MTMDFNKWEDSDYPEAYTVSFEMTKGTDRRYVFEGTYNEDVPWSMIMQRFVEFLEGTGYIGVKQKVSVEDSPFLEGYWFGPVHDAPMSKQEKEMVQAAMEYYTEDDWK